MTELMLPLGILENGQPLILRGRDAERHMSISAITGAGKSVLLVWISLVLMRQHIQLIAFDPTGDMVRMLIGHLLDAGFFQDTIAQWAKRLWIIRFSDPTRAIPFNVLCQRGTDPHVIASQVLEAFKRVYPTTSSTPAMDNCFLAGLYVLSKQAPPLPITAMQKLLLDESYRQTLIPAAMDDPDVCDFLTHKITDKSNLIDSALRRCFNLTFSPYLRNCLSQPDNLLDMKTILASGRSILFDLSGLDEFSMRIIGCLLLVFLENSFESRSRLAPEQRPRTHVVIDEFIQFCETNEKPFSHMLELIRKQAGTLYLAHQTLSQLSPGIAGSLQNALSVVLKQGPDDAATQAARFFRKTATAPAASPSLIDLIFGDTEQEKQAPPSAFTGIETQADARYLFETLKTGEAIVRIGAEPLRIRVPTLSQPRATEQDIQAIMEAYAQLLLRPVVPPQPPPSTPAMPVRPQGGQGTKARRRTGY